MLRAITYEQLTEWAAFAEMEPFDEARDDYRTASVVAAVWNAARWSQSTREHPYRAQPIEGFRLKFDDDGTQPSQRTQTWQEQKQMAELWVKAYNEPPR